MELITISESRIGPKKIQTVNARELHGFLESKQQFSHWINDRIAAYGFVEDKDFTTCQIILSTSSGSKYGRDYHLTLDMAKELSMVERNAKGKEARQYFIAVEKRYQDTPTQPKIPQTFYEALRLAADVA
jgi:anti-repressor protein